MKISKLIKELQKFKEEFGDKGVYTWDGDSSCLTSIKKISKETLEENRIVCFLEFDA